jgi:molecular chaperone GrpE
MSPDDLARDPDPAQTPSGSAADESAADAQSRIAQLEADLAGSQDQLLRTLADQENFRRRLQREGEDAVKFAVSGLARDLLVTVDNLRRAIESTPGEVAVDDAARQWLTGIEATERGLLEMLDRHGVRRIDPLGEPFDPNRHQAVFQRPDDQHPAGTVVEVLQPGYLHHDRLLRPAAVGVAGDRGEAPVASFDIDSVEMPLDDGAR